MSGKGIFSAANYPLIESFQDKVEKGVKQLRNGDKFHLEVEFLQKHKNSNIFTFRSSTLNFQGWKQKILCHKKGKIPQKKHENAKQPGEHLTMCKNQKTYKFVIEHFHLEPIVGWSLQKFIV